MHKGDILISCSGSVGRVCIVDKDEEYVMVRSAALFKPFKKYFKSKMLKYIYQSPLVQDQIIAKSKTTAQSNLFLGRIKEIIIPCIPLPEQEAIINKVDCIMQLCDDLESQVKQSQQDIELLMQVVLKEAFENKESSTISVFKTLHMDRTACYGHCPVYKVIVNSKGDVTFHGKSWVRKIVS